MRNNIMLRVMKKPDLCILKNKAAHDKHKDLNMLNRQNLTKSSCTKRNCHLPNTKKAILAVTRVNHLAPKEILRSPCKKGDSKPKTDKKGNTCCYKSKS